jgi:pyruvate oxidase
MAKYRCTVCNYVCNEEKEKIKSGKLPEGWRCPVCNSPISVFVELDRAAATTTKFRNLGIF